MDIDKVTDKIADNINTMLSLDNYSLEIIKAIVYQELFKLKRDKND